MFQSVDQRERERDIQKLGIKIKEKSKPFTSIFVKKRNAQYFMKVDISVFEDGNLAL